MRKIKKIIIHCSASENENQDSAQAVRQLHTDPVEVSHIWGNYKTTGKGWRDIGYHFYIRKNGLIEKGRELAEVGAHCQGQNRDSVGVCLGGDKNFTQEQFKAARELLFFLCRTLELGNDQIFGHCHFNNKKSCPNFDVSKVLPL